MLGRDARKGGGSEEDREEKHEMSDADKRIRRKERWKYEGHTKNDISGRRKNKKPRQ